MRKRALEWAEGRSAWTTTEAAPTSRREHGLAAAWRAWSDVPYPSNGLKLHSKCVGFAAPRSKEYFAVYLMNRSSLIETGEYAYGNDPMVGWPESNPGSFGVYDPPPTLAREEAWGAAASAAATNRFSYHWSGAYDVTERPWFVQGRSSASSSPSSSVQQGVWTSPYTDPVTFELIVSYVVPLDTTGLLHGGVVIAGTWEV